MKLALKFSAFVLLIAALFNLSCKKEISCEDCATKNNKPPIAIAGPDQAITLPTDSVLLDGSSSSNPDGMISNYLWTKISGPVSLFYFLSKETGSNVQNFLLRMNAGNIRQ